MELLKVASAAMGIGPHQAMQIAERLYTGGYISYPRTESSAYPPGFDFSEALREQSRHPLWGDFAAGLLRQGFAAPKVPGGPKQRFLVPVPAVFLSFLEQRGSSRLPQGTNPRRCFAAGCLPRSGDQRKALICCWLFSSLRGLTQGAALPLLV